MKPTGRDIQSLGMKSQAKSGSKIQVGSPSSARSSMGSGGVGMKPLAPKQSPKQLAQKKSPVSKPSAGGGILGKIKGY